MLILASASKARSSLLSQAKIAHKVIISGLDENIIHSSDPKHLVKALAETKASTVLNKISSNQRIYDLSFNISGLIGCDSVFEFQGEIFGKPSDKQEAILRWEKMSSRSGFLHTGHTLYVYDSSLDQRDVNGFKDIISEIVTTKIYFEKLTKQDIEAYVETGEPFSCAGGFALEGLGGMFISRIEGCYSNVIGLSLPWLKRNYL